MGKPFKSLTVQRFKVFGFLILTLELLNPLNLERAFAQAKIAKIGFLGAGSAATGTWVERLRKALATLGYVDGKNIAFVSRFADNKLDQLPALADELARLKPDVIIAPGANDTRAAKNATKMIPIVFLGGVSDPVALGLVDSLSHPGGNITGFTTIGEVLAGKRLEFIKETVPKLSRLAVLWDPQNPGSAQIWKESQLPARSLGLQLHSLEVSSADKFESGFNEAAKAVSTALAVTQGAFLVTNQTQIVNLVAKNRLPAIYMRGDWVVSGGLMSYGPDEIEPYQRAAVMVDKILKGTKPADIPVEQPTKFELVINLKTAKALGLTLPPMVLTRATKVIK